MSNTIHVEATVRNPEDASVNGVDELEDTPQMPFLEKKGNDWVWCIDIDIDKGTIVNWPIGTKANTWYKVCDECKITYKGAEYDNYVPEFLCPDDEGWGDYIDMTIREDGGICRWKEYECKEFIEKELKVSVAQEEEIPQPQKEEDTKTGDTKDGQFNPLQFPATEEEQAAARRIWDKIRDKGPLPTDFFDYNLPLQILGGDDGAVGKERFGNKCLNYMPRKERTEELSWDDLFEGNPYDEQDLKDVCTVTAAVLKNLARLFIEFRDGKRNCVYYADEK